MLVVKIEMWPGGDGRKAREIGRTYIANRGGTDERGDYEAAVCRRGTTQIPQDWTCCHLDPKATRTGWVEDYPRLSYNVWRLIIRSLRACFPEES